MRSICCPDGATPLPIDARKAKEIALAREQLMKSAFVSGMVVGNLFLAVYQNRRQLWLLHVYFAEGTSGFVTYDMDGHILAV